MQNAHSHVVIITMQDSCMFPKIVMTSCGKIPVLALLAVVCFLILPVMAHPPSDMSVSYNEISHTLAVTITHQVPNPQTHYIREVLVTINGKTVNDTFYTSQPAPDTLTYMYPIDTKTGDEIVVTASCVLSGSLTRTLYNTGPIATTPFGATADPATTKASASLLPLLDLAMYIGYRKG
jgi:hypothetical protein